jgi:hypothetical protein
MLDRGHEGDCICTCAFDEHGNEMPNMNTPEGAGNGNVGNVPYYGDITRFYGEDAADLGLDGDHRWSQA